MRFAYADPPYPGRAHLYRAVDRPDAAEVDHAELVERLVREYPDGWALSTDSRGLWTVLPLVKASAAVRPRLAIWSIPDAQGMGVGHPHGRDSRVVFGWEAVVFAGGRGRPAMPCRDIATIGRPDRAPGGFVGQKPSAFAVWLCNLLGVMAGDTVDDLFPGSGAFGRAVTGYLVQLPLPKPPRTHSRTGSKLRGGRGWADPSELLPGMPTVRAKR